MKHITPYNLFENNTTNQINSANFIKWFGDWKNDPEKSSKVTENGTPKICYHGTYEKFDTFDITTIGKGSGNYGHYGYGFYFSDDIREAKTYGNTIMKVYLNIRNPFIPSDENYDLLKDNGIYWIDDKKISSIDYDSLYNEIKNVDETAARLLELIHKNGYSNGWKMFMDEDGLKNKNILDLNDVTDIYRMTEKDSYPNISVYDYGINMDNLKYNYGYEYHQSMHWITNLGERSKEVTEVIKKLGFDGIIAGSEHIVFDPENIKSIENNGNFSNSDNIYETYIDHSESYENTVKELDELFHKKYIPEYVWVISENENILLYIYNYDKYDSLEKLSIFKKIKNKNEKYTVPGKYSNEPIHIDFYSMRSIIKLIEDAKRYQKLASYKYQKNFLTNTPEKYKDLLEDIKIVGFAPGIKDEFDWLFNAIDMKLM